MKRPVPRRAALIERLDDRRAYAGVQLDELRDRRRRTALREQVHRAANERARFIVAGDLRQFQPEPLRQPADQAGRHKPRVGQARQRVDRLFDDAELATQQLQPARQESVMVVAAEREREVVEIVLGRGRAPQLPHRRRRLRRIRG